MDTERSAIIEPVRRLEVFTGAGRRRTWRDEDKARLQALYDSLKHRPETTQGSGLADVMAYKDPSFRRRDFSSLMRKSRWATGQ
jgi:hypothetical protein